jgi:hypothetical protein
MAICELCTHRLKLNVQAMGHCVHKKFLAFSKSMESLTKNYMPRLF